MNAKWLAPALSLPLLLNPAYAIAQDEPPLPMGLGGTAQIESEEPALPAGLSALANDSDEPSLPAGPGMSPSDEPALPAGLGTLDGDDGYAAFDDEEDSTSCGTPSVYC